MEKMNCSRWAWLITPPPQPSIVHFNIKQTSGHPDLPSSLRPCLEECWWECSNTAVHSTQITSSCSVASLITAGHIHSSENKMLSASAREFLHASFDINHNFSSDSTVQIVLGLSCCCSCEWFNNVLCFRVSAIFFNFILLYFLNLLHTTKYTIGPWFWSHPACLEQPSSYAPLMHSCLTGPEEPFNSTHCCGSIYFQTDLYVPTGGILLCHVPLLHAIHTVLSWYQPSWCVRWNPLLYHTGFWQT